ncbi:MAG: hypothetical protein OCC46_12865 [Pseudodesulfovibrio sp.]
MILIAAFFLSGISSERPIHAILIALVCIPLVFFQIRPLIKNFSSKPILETSALGITVNQTSYRIIPWESVNYIGFGIDRNPRYYFDSSKHISIFYFQGDDWKLARNNPSIFESQKKKRSTFSFQAVLKQEPIVFGIYEPLPTKHIEQLQERWLLAVEGKSCPV